MTDNHPDRGPTGSERLMAQAGRKRDRLFSFSSNGSLDLSERMMLGSTPQSIGAELRAARLAAGETTADVSRQLCLRQSYIEAIEEGDFASLPGVAYAIGFVRSYARYLRLDADSLIERFKEEVSDIPPPADLAFLEPVSESRVPRIGLVMVALLMAVVAYGGWYYLSTRNMIVADMVPPVPEQFAGLTSPIQPASPPSVTGDREVAPPGPHNDASDSAAEAAAVAASATDGAPAAAEPVAPDQKPAAAAAPVAPAPALAVPAVPPIAAPETAAATAESDDGRVSGAGAGSRITVRAGGDSWIQIRAADESLLVTRTLRKGESYRVPNQPGLKLITGNAGALEILVDGQPTPAIGPVGAVKRNVALDADRLRAGTAAN